MAATKKQSRYIQQYTEAKAKNPDMLLLFRFGDFYEAFAENAKTMERALGLSLTVRDKDFPMCGFPARDLDHYLRKLLAQQHRVAVLEEVK